MRLKKKKKKKTLANRENGRADSSARENTVVVSLARAVVFAVESPAVAPLDVGDEPWSSQHAAFRRHCVGFRVRGPTQQR